MWNRMMFVAVLALVVSGHAEAAETVFVQSVRAKILAAPEFGADVVAVANKGDALPVLGQQARWVRVRRNDTEGWVPSLVVRDRPPLEKTSVLAEEGEPVQNRARRRASAASAAGATRGLMADNRRRAEEEAEADYQALSEVESLRIPADEVNAFLEYLRQP